MGVYPRLIVDNSGGGYVRRSSGLLKKAVRQRHLRLVSHCGDKIAVAPSDPVFLPLVDRIPVNRSVRPLAQPFGNGGAIAERFDQFGVVMHDTSIIGSLFRLVKTPISHDLKKIPIHSGVMPANKGNIHYKVACGLRLQQIRVALGFDTRRSFAAALPDDVSEDRLAKWEDGAAMMPARYAAFIKARWGVTIDWLFAGDPMWLPATLYNELLRQFPDAVG